MHPKQIIADFKKIGSPLVLDGENVYIDNPENVYPELEELAKTYKSVLVKYLKGEYTDKQYNVDQTIEKIIDYYRTLNNAANLKIDSWLQNDSGAVDLIINLCESYWNNGWKIEEPFVNYSDFVTDELSVEIYERAMAFFRGG